MTEICQKQPEQVLLLLAEELFANLILLRGKILLRGFLLFEQLQHHTVGSGRDRPADFCRLHRKRDRGLPGHASDVGDLPVGKHQVADLEGGPQFLGGALQIVFGLRPIRQFLRLLGQENPGALVPELVFDLLPNFFEGGSCRGTDAQHLEHDCALG